MGIAIVTGASSGMGREFVRQLAKREQLEEIWVVARREERLSELKQQITGTQIRPLALDLTQRESIRLLSALLTQEKPEVHLLINAAGFGKFAMSADMPMQDTGDMIDLNCKAAVCVTQAVLPYMVKGSRILEICSAASFQPLPGLNLYAATKAFLYSYTRALRWEVRSRGIKVCAVCPGWVRTEFFSVAGDTQNIGRTVRHFPFMAKAERVVRCALRDSRWGLPVSAYGVAFLHRIAVKFIPHELVIAAWEGIRRI